MTKEFFTPETLPSSLKMIGDNISHLRYGKIRDVVNSELSLCAHERMKIEFNVNDQDQLVTTFYNNDVRSNESIVIRSNALNELVQKINNVFFKIITEKETIMNKKTKKVTDVTVVSNEAINASSVSSNCISEMGGTEFLSNFVSEHYSGSGCFHEVEKFLDVPRLFSEKSNGAVIDVIMNETEFTIVGINNFTMTCSVKGVNLEILRKQVCLMLQTIIDYQQEFTDMIDVSTACKCSTTEQTVTEEPEHSLRKGQKIRSVLHKNSKKVVDKYNKAVYDRTADLEGELKGKRSSSSSQTIRKRLSLLATENGLKTKDMSGQSLVSELNRENIDLLRELCFSAQCKVPSFLSENLLTQKVRMKG